MRFLTTAVLITIFAGLAFAQPVALEKVGQRLDKIQSANFWSRVTPELRQIRETKSVNPRPMGGGSPVSTLNQMAGVVEVIGTPGGSFNINFTATKPADPGSLIATGVIMSDDTVVHYQSYNTGLNQDGTGWIVSANLQNGPFAYSFLPGQTTFFAVMMSPSGKVSYAWQDVWVWAGADLVGPLSRADISPNGSTLTITGTFSGDVVAMVSGNPLSVSFSPFNHFIGYISLEQFGQGQQLSLTVCSQGACSTRQLYVTSNSNPGIG